MNTGGSIVGCHESYEQALSKVYLALRWFRDRNVLLSNYGRLLLVVFDVLMVANLFMGTPAPLARGSRELFLERFSKSDAESVFLVG